MIKRFRIRTPMQLRTLSTYCTYYQNAVGNMAKIWNADRIKNGGVSKWDECFSVRFESVDRKRNSYLELITPKRIENGTRPEVAEFQYNKALAFCRANLPRIVEVAE